MAKLGEYYDKLPTMTAQEVVEVAITHLVNQGTRSGLIINSGSFKCMYLDKSGNCCGAAPFINPGLDLETYNFRAYVILTESNNAHEDHAELIEDIQRFHDNVEPAEWVDEVEDYFSHYSIDWGFLGRLNQGGEYAR